MSTNMIPHQDQWQKKKQTKEEAAAARRGKLDPDSELNRNAKQVMDERAKNKRKLREMEQEKEDDEDSFEDVDGVEQEKPGEGLKKPSDEPNKKQKLDESNADEDESNPQPDALSTSQEKRAAKMEKKKEQKAEQRAAKRAAKAAKKAGKSQSHGKDSLDQEEVSIPQKSAKKGKAEQPQEDADEPPVGQEDAGPEPNDPIETDTAGGLEPSLDFSALQENDKESHSSIPESDAPSVTFDIEPSTDAPATTADAASAATSVSSTAASSGKPKHIKIPADSPALRARLAAKLEALRAARKADGTDGRPIRTRQELIESRRAKQAQRKATKKELRNSAKLEEERKREEALASNSPSVMSPAVDLDESAANFSFGRVAFGDGAQLSHDLSYVLNRGKKKGPSDPKTALLKVQNQKQHLQDMGEEKRNDITEKEAWLTARRRAEGAKIHDDETMLKKAVKRQETAKRKSEKAWKERARGVGYAQKERQKKREENIKKRRDDKLLGKSGRKKKKSAAGAKKKGGRPGFEGSLGLKQRK